MKMTNEDKIKSHLTNCLSEDFEILSDVVGLHIIEKKEVKFDFMLHAKRHLLSKGFDNKWFGVETKHIAPKPEKGLTNLFGQCYVHYRRESMGDGRKDDYIAKTRKVLAGILSPLVEGCSWLDHKGQAGQIDQMIFESEYTLEEIATAIHRAQSPDHMKEFKSIRKRVKNHIDHLKDGWNRKMAPHSFKVVEDASGIVKFDFEKMKIPMPNKPVQRPSGAPSQEPTKTMGTPPDRLKLQLGRDKTPTPGGDQLDSSELFSKVVSDIEGLEAELGKKEHFECGQKQRLVSIYERDSTLRTQAILIHGTRCKVCGFDFQAFYGEQGTDYIEVHHLRPVSTLNGREQVDPTTDMTVLCSNCHRMVHRSKDKVLSPEELRLFIKSRIVLPQ